MLNSVGRGETQGRWRAGGGDPSVKSEYRLDVGGCEHIPKMKNARFVFLRGDPGDQMARSCRGETRGKAHLLRDCHDDVGKRPRTGT